MMYNKYFFRGVSAREAYEQLNRVVSSFPCQCVSVSYSEPVSPGEVGGVELSVRKGHAGPLDPILEIIDHFGFEKESQGNPRRELMEEAA